MSASVSTRSPDPSHRTLLRPQGSYILCAARPHREPTRKSPPCHNKRSRKLTLPHMKPPLRRSDIEAIIPHREPFIFVDRIVEVDYGHRAVGFIDDIGAFDEHILRGHFPGFPIMPGAILVEALAEVGGVAALGLPANRAKIAMLTGLDKWKFRRPARPGDRVRLETELIRLRANFGRGKAKATIGDTLVAEGEISFAIVDRPLELR